MSRRALVLFGSMSVIWGIPYLFISIAVDEITPATLVLGRTAIPSAGALGSVLILAVVWTAAAFMLFGALIDEVGPVRATVITYVNPAVAAVLGVVVLRETLTLAMGVGFVLVIAGSMLATRPARSARLGVEPVPA